MMNDTMPGMVGRELFCITAQSARGKMQKKSQGSATYRGSCVADALLTSEIPRKCESVPMPRGLSHEATKGARCRSADGPSALVGRDLRARRRSGNPESRKSASLSLSVRWWNRGVCPLVSDGGIGVLRPVSRSIVAERRHENVACQATFSGKDESMGTDLETHRDRLQHDGDRLRKPQRDPDGAPGGCPG